MIMKKSILILATLAAVLLAACISGDRSRSNSKTVTKTYKPKAFNSISAEGNIYVHYTQGNRTSVIVKTNDKALKHFRLTVEDSTLTLRNKHKGWFLSGGMTETINVYVVSPDLTGVGMAGSCGFKAPRHVDTDNMEIEIAGSGNVEFGSLICDSLSVSIAGAGDMEIKQLNTGYSNISIAGSGCVSVKGGNIGNAENEIAGSGTIELAGNIKRHTEDVAGSGSITINGK